MFSALFYRLFAQLDSLEGFVNALRDRRGRGDYGEILSSLMVLTIISVAVWLLARGFDRLCRRRSYSAPYRLLWSLSRAHRLRWSQWWLLRRIARQENMDDPARLFLEPEWLDPARLGPEFANQGPQILVLRARLFVDLADMGSPAQ